MNILINRTGLRTSYVGTPSGQGGPTCSPRCSWCHTVPALILHRSYPAWEQSTVNWECWGKSSTVGQVAKRQGFHSDALWMLQKGTRVFLQGHYGELLKPRKNSFPEQIRHKERNQGGHLPKALGFTSPSQPHSQMGFPKGSC